MGSKVKKGDTLAVLDPEEFELRVQQAESQWRQARASLGLAEDASEADLDPQKAPSVRQEKAMLNDAKSKLERAQTLYRQRAVAIEELQQLEAAEDAAQARYDSSLNAVDEKLAVLGVRRTELAMARREQKEATIVAPFDGIVRERHVAPGVYVQIGSPVVSLVRTNPLRFRAGVPEIDAMRIEVGQNVRIKPEGRDELIEAPIARISPSVDPSSRALAIEVDVPNGESKLRAGLFGEAEIVVDPDAQALAVPESAVREFAGVEKVWTIENGKAVEKPIRSGRRENGYVEILDGLSPGTMVASDALKTKPGPVVIRDTEVGQSVQHSE
jgi:RND family efflux transporter MFP subunit